MSVLDLDLFFQWWNGRKPVPGFDPEDHLAEDIQVDWHFETTGIEPLLEHRKMSMGMEQTRMVHQVSDGVTTTFVYEAIDPVTLLRHKCVLAVVQEGPKITSVTNFASVGRMPEGHQY